MGSLKRLGIVLAVAAALGVPSTASAFSLGWLKSFFNGLKEREHQPHREWSKWYNHDHRDGDGCYDKPNDPKPPPAVPEPTAALLFGAGLVVAGAASRRRIRR